MKKIIFIFFIIFLAIFFLGPQPNTRSDINYSVVDNHITNLKVKDKDEIEKYIIRAAKNYNLNYEVDEFNNIYVSTSDNMAENEVLITTTYDLSVEEDDNYAVIASTISSLQLSSKYGNNSGITVIFFANSDYTIDTIKERYSSFDNIKYLYLLNETGFDGEYIIKSTSTNNNQIIDIFNLATTNPTGYVALSKTTNSDVQYLELGTLNDSTSKDSILGSSKRDLVNVIHEITYFDYDSYQKTSSYRSHFLMYLDLFIVIPANIVYVIGVIALVLALLALTLNFKQLRIRQIVATVLTISFALSVAVAVSLLPFNEIFKDYPYLVYQIGHLTQQVIISNPLGLLIVTAAAVACVIGINHFLLNSNNVSLINLLTGINLLLVIAAVTLVVTVSQITMVVLSLILANSLVIILRYNLKLKRAVVPGIMIIILIPLLISNIYLLYTGVVDYNITVYAVLFTTYTIVIVQLLKMFFQIN